MVPHPGPLARHGRTRVGGDARRDAVHGRSERGNSCGDRGLRQQAFSRQRVTEAPDFDPDVLATVEIDAKYEGYVRRELERAEKLRAQADFAIPADAPYGDFTTLSFEARQKLSRIRPRSLAQAGRIPGVSPADLQNLVMEVRRMKSGGSEVRARRTGSSPSGMPDRKDMRSFTPVWILLLAAASCGDSSQAGTETVVPRTVSEVCGVLVGGASSGEVEVVAAGDDAPCTIEFREVTRLRSQSDGIAADLPGGCRPRGNLCDGDLPARARCGVVSEGGADQVDGKRRGGGTRRVSVCCEHGCRHRLGREHLPGVTALASVLMVRDFIETIRAPAAGGLGEAALGPDGVLVAKTQGPEGARLVLWRPGSEVRIVDGSFTDGFGWGWLSASLEMGLWSAVDSRYTIRRHALPSGAVDFEIHRRVDWFRSNDRGKSTAERRASILCVGSGFRPQTGVPSPLGHSRSSPLFHVEHLAVPP